MSYAPMPVNLERIHDKVAALAANAPTLRDQFAMAALPAILTATCAGQHTPKVGVTLEASMALDAYNIADAMLAAGGDQ